MSAREEGIDDMYGGSEQVVLIVESRAKVLLITRTFGPPHLLRTIVYYYVVPWSSTGGLQPNIHFLLKTPTYFVQSQPSIKLGRSTTHIHAYCVAQHRTRQQAQAVSITARWPDPPTNTTSTYRPVNLRQCAQLHTQGYAEARHKGAHQRARVDRAGDARHHTKYINQPKRVHAMVRHSRIHKHPLHASSA